MKRVLKTLGTAAVVGAVMFGSATQASAATQIRGAGPYSTYSACTAARQEVIRYGNTAGVHGVTACTYYGVREVSGRYLPAGYYFTYLVGY